MNSSKYTSRLGNALNEFRKRNQLCDVTINIGGRAFHVHKALLAASSSYFMAMFTSGFSESTQSEINIDGNADIFEILLEFTYTGKMKITAKTAYDILEMACYMQFKEACEACSEFMEYNYVYTSRNKPDISVGDAYKIAKLAGCHDINDHLKELALNSEKYMCRYIELLKCNDVFLQLADMNFLNSFMERRFLSSKKEEKEVFEMVVNWLKHDWSSRCTYALELLQKVRLGLVPAVTLMNLLDAAILEIPECKQLVDEVFILQMSDHSSTALAQDFPNLFATRSTTKVPVIMSSLDDGSLCNFHFYDSEDKNWHPLYGFAPLPHLASLIVVDASLYAVGGIEVINNNEPRETCEMYDDEFKLEKECRNSILCYDDENNVWTRLPSSMKTARHSLLLVHMDRFIYAIGGSENDDRYGLGDKYLHRVERYNLEKMEWQDVASLPKGFTWTSAVVFQGNLLVYGVGYEDHHKHVLVVYNANSNTWARKLSEHNSSYLRLHPFQVVPALLVHEDICYRVSCHETTYTRTRPAVPISVNILKLNQSRRSVTIEVGEAIQQDQIPANMVGAFRIQDEVFVNLYGLIYKTALTISADQSTTVNLDNWRACSDRSNLHNSNGVSLIVDTKLLAVGY